MELKAATDLMNSLMYQHGLDRFGWTFKWDSSKKRFGLCQYGSKRIKISKALTLINTEAEVRDTMLHEIAHALVGPGHGHGWVWKMKAKQVGARPEACYSASNVKPVESPYTGTCLDCGTVIPRFKAPRASMLRTGYHPKCRYKANRGKLEWRMRGLLMIAPAPATVVLPAPMWQRQEAAHKPAPEAKPELSQADITSMMERLNRLDEKL